jgi:hypothetical protein
LLVFYYYAPRYDTLTTNMTSRWATFECIVFHIGSVAERNETHTP